jgi:hypothetical protein
VVRLSQSEDAEGRWHGREFGATPLTRGEAIAAKNRDTEDWTRAPRSAQPVRGASQTRLCLAAPQAQCWWRNGPKRPGGGTGATERNRKNHLLEVNFQYIILVNHNNFFKPLKSLKRIALSLYRR